MLLKVLGLIASVLSISMPPQQTVYTSSTRTRGFYFSPPVDVWLVGARPYEDAGQGRAVLDVVYINGQPSIFPEETNAYTLFRYNRTDLNSSYPFWICIQPTLKLSAGVFYGILGGRVTDEEARNVSYSYASINNYRTQVNGQEMFIRRLMNQRPILEAPTSMVMTDEENPMALIEIVISNGEPTSLPQFCEGVPPDPDENPNSTTTDAPNNQQNQISPSSVLSIVF